MAIRVDPRKERARATRLRMIDAAYRLFVERGYGVPLTAIAAEAGVAVQTLYFTFHDKASLLGAVLTEQVVGPADGVPPHLQAWMEELRAQPDVRLALRVMLANTLDIYARVAPLVGLFQGTEPEVAELWEHSEQLRLDGFRTVLRDLAAKQKLRPGLTRNRAADLLFELAGPGVYFAFVHQRGWRPEEWLEMTADLAAYAIFGAG